MPYVSEFEVPQGTEHALNEIQLRLGPPPWRQPLVASSALRVVLWFWAPGFRTVPHVHPRADEVFHILRGRAAFNIGDAEDRIVGPHTILLAQRGVRHRIRVVGDEPLLLMIVLAPNEDADDETIEHP